LLERFGSQSGISPYHFEIQKLCFFQTLTIRPKIQLTMAAADEFLSPVQVRFAKKRAARSIRPKLQSASSTT